MTDSDRAGSEALADPAVRGDLAGREASADPAVREAPEDLGASVLADSVDPGDRVDLRALDREDRRIVTVNSNRSGCSRASSPRGR